MNYDSSYYAEPDWRKLGDAQQQIDRAMEEISSPTSLVAAALKRRDGMDAGIEMPWSKLQGLFELRAGEVVIFGGRTGSYKSTVTTQIAVHALRQGYKVGIASLELPPSDVLEMMTEIAATTQRPAPEWMGDFASVVDDRLMILNRVDTISPMETIRSVIAMKMLFGADLIVLDAFMMLGIDDQLQSEKEMMATLVAAAKQYNVCILLVAHARKPSGPKGEKEMPSRYDIMGTSAIVNLAASIVLVHPNRQKLQDMNNGFEVDDNEADLVISVQKQRNAKYEGSVGLYLKKSCRVFCNSRARLYKPWELTEPIPIKTFEPERNGRLQLAAANSFDLDEYKSMQGEKDIDYNDDGLPDTDRSQSLRSLSG